MNNCNLPITTLFLVPTILQQVFPPEHWRREYLVLMEESQSIDIAIDDVDIKNANK